MNHAPSYTAAQLAKALGRSKWGVCKALRDTMPAGYVASRGQKAAGWRFDQLPESFRAELLETATARGFRDVAHLLAAPPARWEPRRNGEVLKFSEISAEGLDSAAKLRRALQPSVEQIAGGSNIAAAEPRGLEDYRREFGYSITSRHWRSLIERALTRDAGADDLGRLEIYLPERVKIKSGTAKKCNVSVQTLETALHQLSTPASPSNADKEQIWIAACDQMADSLAAQVPERMAKRTILRRLDQWGHLAASGAALRRSFDRKWKAFENTGRDAAVIRDGRAGRYATPPVQLPEEDRKTLIARSLDCGARLGQAWRECLQGGELSSETTTRFIQNPRRKSYVPESVRRELRPDVDRLMPLHHGPREEELSGPHFRRDYSGMYAGDSFQADDATNPVYYWEPDFESPTGYRVQRGQFLLMIDERSLLPLGYALHSEPTYNARIIRSLITHVHDDYGLPRKRFYFENGIWKAKVLRGDEIDTAHTEKGLREFGIRFQHARLPRAKVVERVFGMLQNQMERLPGYVGRDEVNDRFERIQEKLNAARSGRLHPGEFLMNKDQYCAALDQMLEAYSREPQEGGILAGLSPADAWNRFQSPEPLMHLGGKMRYYLAHHRIPLKISKSTITLRPSLGGGRYCNEITGRFNGERVLVWVDPEHLDCIGITRLDQKGGAFIVPRLEDIPAIDATPELIAAGRRQIDDARAYSKTLYRSVCHRFTRHNFRKLIVDEETMRRGEEFETQRSRTRAVQNYAKAKMRGIRETGRELGVMPRRVTPQTVDRVAEGMELMREAVEAESAAGAGTPVAVATAPKVKTYKLKAVPAKQSRKQLLAAYWKSWQQIEKLRPGTNRHAVTQRTLGRVPRVEDMSDADLGNMVRAFASMIREENK